MIRPPPISTLFPYPTLFRSSDATRAQDFAVQAFLELAAVVQAGERIAHRLQVQLQLDLQAKRDPLTRLYRSEEHTSQLQSHNDLVCRLLLDKKKTTRIRHAQ